MQILTRLLTVILTILSLSLIAQSTDSAEVQKTDIIHFKLSDYNNISIQAILNGADTVNLMFHTAADALALTEAATKNLKTIHFTATTDSVKSWGSQSNSSRLSPDNVIKIGELTWTKVPIWEDVNSGQYTDGKFGINLFQNRVIEIDFDHKIIRLTSSIPKKVKKYQKVKLEKKDDLLFLKATCQVKDSNFVNSFLIHSGYSGAILLDDEFVTAHKLGDKLEIVGEKSLKDSYGNIVKTKQAILPSLTIQTNTLSKVPAGFFEGAIGRQKMSIIGGDILKRFNLIIDAKREFIYLKPNSLAKSGYKKM